MEHQPTIQRLFTPIFIILGLIIFIGGVVFMQLMDRVFAGSKNLNAIRMFFVAIIINIIILLFIILSFSKVKITSGEEGPQGNRGIRGINGEDGGLKVCGKSYQKIEEKKAFENENNYLDLKPPLIVYRD